jgi:regulator of replication initiation timing
MKKSDVTTKDLKNDINDLKADIGDVLQAVNRSFTDVSKEIGGMKQDIRGLKSDVSGLKSDVSSLNSDVSHIKNVMVTKTYLDDKLSQMESRMNLKHKRTDKLAVVLKNKKVITTGEAKQILAN